MIEALIMNFVSFEIDSGDHVGVIWVQAFINSNLGTCWAHHFTDFDLQLAIH